MSKIDLNLFLTVLMFTAHRFCLYAFLLYHILKCCFNFSYIFYMSTFKVQLTYSVPTSAVEQSDPVIYIYTFLFFCLFFFPFLGVLLQRLEVPRLGVKQELQPASCATAIATWDLSRVCNVHHSSWQCRIVNPLSKARDQTCNFMVPSRIC